MSLVDVMCFGKPANEKKFKPIFGVYGVKINGAEHRIISTSSCDAHIWAIDYAEKNNIKLCSVASWKIQ